MARSRSENGHRRSPARTPEAREDELAAAAYDLAEDQIREWDCVVAGHHAFPQGRVSSRTYGAACAWSTRSS
jgi:hypothetical protein